MRCTTVPGAAQPPAGSSGDTPLLTPTVAASRSPMKRGLALAQPASPPRRAPSGGGLLKAATLGAGAAAGTAGAGALASLGSLGRAMNRLKLPRRHASGANEDFGEFAFRPSRFSTPSGSPEGGSPVHLARDVAASGSIFSYAGPSRFGHSRNPSKGSPVAAAAKASPPAAVVTADGSSAAVAGLAAALAVLPPGSPLCHDSSGALGGIELSEAVAGTAPIGGTADLEQVDGASSAGCSTPLSELGGASRARRPLLLEQTLRSTDRLPSSQDREQMERSAGLVHAGAAAEAQQSQQAHGDALLTPLTAAASALRRVPAPCQAERSLSFGGTQRSISLNGELGGGEGKEQAGAASLPPEPRCANTGSAAADTSQGGLPQSTPGSAAELLPLGPQCSSSQGVEPSGGSTAALLPPGGVADSSAGGAALGPLPSRPRHGATSSFEVASALGFQQSPPNPEEIYAAMLSKSGVASAAAAAKAAAGRRGVAGSGDGDGGGEGIATSWWKAYQGGFVGATRA